MNSEHETAKKLEPLPFKRGQRVFVVDGDFGTPEKSLPTLSIRPVYFRAMCGSNCHAAVSVGEDCLLWFEAKAEDVFASIPLARLRIGAMVSRAIGQIKEEIRKNEVRAAQFVETLQALAKQSFYESEMLAARCQD